MIVFGITTWDNRDKRWDNLKMESADHLDTHELHPILAADWRTFTHCGLNEHKAKHLSLALAYYQIAQTAHFEGLGQYIVVEDDISFVGSLPPEHPMDFDLIYLTRTAHNQHAVTQAYDADYALIKSNWWETPITLWSSAFALEFIAWVRAKLQQGLWLGNIDHILMQMNDTGKYRFYGMTRKTAVGLSSEPEYGNMDLEGSISR